MEKPTDFELKTALSVADSIVKLKRIGPMGEAGVVLMADVLSRAVRCGQRAT